MGMVGGGQGAFIGAIHRMAALMDGQIEWVAGALSSTPARASASARALGLTEARSYGTWQEMLAQESRLPLDQRIDFVSIVTPNHTHFEIAAASLKSGFHVMCEKPVCVSVAEARELARIVAESKRQLCVAHTYTGYPLVKEMREQISAGRIGALRKVIVEYSQGWLTRLNADNKQAAWRGDPSQAGLAGCMGDIGTHAANLAEYVTQAKITAVNAELSTFVPGRKLDDDGMVLIKMERGIKGLIHASQVATGEENNLAIKVYGENGGLEWRQQEPNSLLLRSHDAALQILRAAQGLGPLAMANSRTPPGHPEGYIEAFANLYRNFAAAINAQMKAQVVAVDYPNIDAGLRSMQFLEAVVASAGSSSKWLPVEG
jgi:predicted dehydrogenase